MAPRDLRAIVAIGAERAGRIFAIFVASVGMFSVSIFLVPYLHELGRDDWIILDKATTFATVSSLALFAVGAVAYMTCVAAGQSTPSYLGKWTLFALLLLFVDALLLPAIQVA
jgi:hypothetical protein